MSDFWVGVLIGIVLGIGTATFAIAYAIGKSDEQPADDPERALHALRYGPPTTTRRSK